MGLADPGSLSPKHAVVTYISARLFADGMAKDVPRTNTNPAPILRVLAAASRGRADAMGTDIARFPSDLASPVWRRVTELTTDPGLLSSIERRVAADVLLRLGYVKRASALLGMDGVDAATHRFTDTQVAIKEFAVLYWRSHDPLALEQLALHGASDPSLDADTRLSLATFVIVRNGKLRIETAEMHQAIGLGESALAELPVNHCASSLAKQSYYRGLAFLPFLRHDEAGTFELLDRALQAQADAVPRGELEGLAWTDYAFPLFETLAKTNLLTGRFDSALAATDRLLELSPHDHRAWVARGQALVELGELEEALAAYTHMEALGGLPAAAATFYQGWIHEQLGNPDLARACFERSQSIDPTVEIGVKQ
ncbi:tetratricopeptide repeat protein [Actinokineospora iranica]|uniref:tetratricopeptide repeat protein n=1 Tax=Actinokineospora iranica TaxID=1271860 RepID=UPI001586FC05|nr:tetratricopeptide repeat protein [Actinokineospora iranica]